MEHKTGKIELIKDAGCEFRVHRKRKSSKVISISLWKSKPGYIFNLSNAVVWWARYAKVMYPGWNVRFYMDGSIYQKVEGDIKNWDLIVEQLQKWKNVELWFYYCKWGRAEPKKLCKLCHSNTFGSVIRFHAFQDPDVEVVISRNVELLSSPKIDRLVYYWLNNPDYQYHIAYNPSYTCAYSEILCEKLGLKNANMIPAGIFGYRKNSKVPPPYPDIFNVFHQYISENSALLKKFPYGVDEILLDKFFKPLMTPKNTYVTYRTVFEDFISQENECYRQVWIYMLEYLDELRQQYPQNKSIRESTALFNDDSLAGIIEKYPSEGMLMFTMLEKYTPEYIHDLLRYVKTKISPTLEEEKMMEIWNKQLSEKCLKLFINNDPDFSFHPQENTERGCSLFFYFATKVVIFETIDFIGYSLKSKENKQKIPILPEIPDTFPESEIEKNMKPTYNLKKGRTRDEAIAYLRKLAEKRRRIVEDDLNIFFNNIKQKYLFVGNKDY